MKILFPSVAGMLPKFEMLKRYHNTYYMYIYNIFLRAGAELELIGDTAVADGTFAMWVDGKEIYIDYSDHLRPVQKEGVASFKFHCSEDKHEGYDNIFPFPPVSFYDWGQYYLLSERIVYNATGPYIVCRQKPYGNARERRIDVQNTLAKRFGERFHRRQLPQLKFWEEVSSCSVAVVVPGCRNNMLDRGHLQYLAFGCCTISPPIINYLPYNTKLVSGVHYIECKPDYSNVVEKIEWAERNKAECLEIGLNARKLFQSTCTPEKLIPWVRECIERV